ncbi:MAG: UDP-N-acetylglucosamine 1-carboxyvinyltransferase [Tissierellales bacterium]|jgi:UDP-N-acetylglucosamine 1-carboxyvinyltransferase|nr:UDP-N-acetylglucosamine 1-carboxyvinyltransferase [Tissierellales bacterium]
MEKLAIEGGKRLQGSVKVSGFKNAVLPIMAATILCGDKCTIENVPMIKDVKTLIDILKSIGGTVNLVADGIVEIDTKNVRNCEAPHEFAKQLRASYYLLGGSIGRFKEANVSYPGGCNIGTRPIDQHIKGFEALGCKVGIEHGVIKCRADELEGTKIYLDVVSIGATINIMMSAVLAKGQTIIENAAKEPHVVDTANFLNAMGAEVKGAGTDVIRINGVEKLHGCTYSVIPDQIEAGTYMIASAATGGDVLIQDVIPKHLESVTAKLREMGVSVEEFDDAVRVKVEDELKGINVKTLPYPGFPTDLQQPLSALLSVTKGTSIVTESIFESRFKYVDELKKMGAMIKVDGKTSVISGVDQLDGATISATDLRAGAACIIAGLIAKGTTRVEEIYHIERGYDRIVEKLRGLGASIEKIED